MREIRVVVKSVGRDKIIKLNTKNTILIIVDFPTTRNVTKYVISE